MNKEKAKTIKDQKPTRTTIPAEMVKELDVKTGDLMEWEIKNKKLRGELRQ